MVIVHISFCWTTKSFNSCLLCFTYSSPPSCIPSYYPHLLPSSYPVLLLALSQHIFHNSSTPSPPSPLGLMSTVRVASSLGVEGIEMGMAHRGRMNVLHNFFQKPLKSIISMFSEAEPSELGDVKYHLGVCVGGECV